MTPKVSVWILGNFLLRQPGLEEKRTTSQGKPKFSKVSYKEFLFHWFIFFKEFPEFSFEWFTFWKFDNFRIFPKTQDGLEHHSNTDKLWTNISSPFFRAAKHVRYINIQT